MSELEKQLILALKFEIDEIRRKDSKIEELEETIRLLEGK